MSHSFGVGCNRLQLFLSSLVSLLPGILSPFSCSLTSVQAGLISAFPVSCRCQFRLFLPQALTKIRTYCLIVCVRHVGMKGRRIREGVARARMTASRLLKYPAERRVRARGLHDFLGNHGSCRPGALTGRVFQQPAGEHSRAVALAPMPAISSAKALLPLSPNPGSRNTVLPKSVSIRAIWLSY